MERPQFLNFARCKGDLLALGVAQDDRFVVALNDYPRQRLSVGRPGEIHGILRLDAARRNEEAFEQLVSRPQFSNRGKVRTNGRAAVSDTMALATVHALRPEYFFAKIRVAL